MMAPLSVEEDNYIRLVLLLIDVCPRAVRSYFDKEFPPDKLYSRFQTNYNTLLTLKSNKILNQIQWKILCPGNGKPNSDNFDVTLMICLIRNLTSVAPPSYRFDILPKQSETSPESDLARIKWYRNQFAHPESGTCTIKGADFNATWKNIADAVGRLGGQRSEYECQELKSKTLDRSIQELLIENRKSQADIKELKDGMARLRGSFNNFKRGCLKRKEEEKATIPKTIHDLLCFGNCMNSAQLDRTSSTKSDSSIEKERIDQSSSSPVDQCFPSTSTDNVTGVAIGNPTFRSITLNPGFVPDIGDSVYYNNNHSSTNILPTKKTITVIAVCLCIVGALAFSLYYKHNLGGLDIFNDPENTNVLLTQDTCEKDVPITLIGQRICIPYTQKFTGSGRDPSFIHVTQLSSKNLRAPKVFSFNVSSATFVQQNGDLIVSFNSSRHDQQFRFVQEKATCDNVGKYEITIEYSGGNVTSFEIEIVLEEPRLNQSVTRMNDSIRVHCEMTNNCKTVSLGLIVNNGESSRLIPDMNECSNNDKKNSPTITADAIIPVSWISGNQTISCVPLMTDHKLAANLTSTMDIPVCEGYDCEPNCKDDPQGIAYYGDKHFCNIFYQCSNGDMVLQNCSSPTYWSHNECTCVHFNYTICDGTTHRFFKPAISFEKCTKT